MGRGTRLLEKTDLVTIGHRTDRMHWVMALGWRELPPETVKPVERDRRLPPPMIAAKDQYGIIRLSNPESPMQYVQRKMRTEGNGVQLGYIGSKAAGENYAHF
jgi:hypothetical protein